MIQATAAQSPVHACAIDSVLLIRQSARRMLCAVQEYCGSMVIVPAEAARESPKVYQNVAAKQARRESRAKARAMRGGWSEKERKAWVMQDALWRKEVKTEAFARWIEEEKQANDSAYTFPRLEEEDRRVAAELAMDALPEEADVVIPGHGGDPLVIAQALLRNAEMVGTDNMDMVDRDSVDGWIAGKTREGRFLQAARPFIRSADAVVASRTCDDVYRDGIPATARIAYGTCRPKDVGHYEGRQLVAKLAAFAGHMENARMPGIARRVRETCEDWAGKEDELIGALEADLWLPEKTRSAEDRRLRIEKELVGRRA